VKLTLFSAKFPVPMKGLARPFDCPNAKPFLDDGAA
jgi:hypothetical protein